MTKEQLLAEVDELVRATPDREVVKGRPEGQAGLGRVLAVIARWNMLHGVSASEMARRTLSRAILP